MAEEERRKYREPPDDKHGEAFVQFMNRTAAHRIVGEENMFTTGQMALAFRAGIASTASATLPPTFTVLQLSKAIEYGVNCHSIDNAANMPDFMIASKIAATVHRRLAEIVTQREYVQPRKCSCGAEAGKYHATGCGYKGVFNG